MGELGRSHSSLSQFPPFEYKVRGGTDLCFDCIALMFVSLLESSSYHSGKFSQGISAQIGEWRIGWGGAGQAGGLASPRSMGHFSFLLDTCVYPFPLSLGHVCLRGKGSEIWLQQVSSTLT